MTKQPSEVFISAKVMGNEDVYLKDESGDIYKNIEAFVTKEL
jgi:hypothetical protein